MVDVRIIKKHGRLSQGTIGRISDSAYKKYGIKGDIKFPHSLSVFVDGNEWTIPNNLLELPKNGNDRKKRKPSREQIRMFS